MARAPLPKAKRSMHLTMNFKPTSTFLVRWPLTSRLPVGLLSETVSSMRDPNVREKNWSMKYTKILGVQVQFE